jgi:hypothetical protein
MPYRFEPGRIYRMPTHFGPAPGPRQMPAEADADPTRSPHKTLISASFLTEGSALECHIPERFTLAGEPVVTIEFHYMTDIDWLAGRGYTMIHVWWPVTFNGARRVDRRPAAGNQASTSGYLNRTAGALGG